MVLDHFGTPLGVGPLRRSARGDLRQQWKHDIADIARCPNVVAKLGGLAMPDNGFGWHTADRPPTSDEFVAAQGRYYLHTIECFGADRCMFETNFPVDRMSLSYRVLWNGLKKIAAEFSESEREEYVPRNGRARVPALTPTLTSSPASPSDTAEWPNPLSSSNRPQRPRPSPNSSATPSTCAPRLATLPTCPARGCRSTSTTVSSRPTSSP